MEINEIIADPDLGHPEQNTDCPFCPKETPDFVTFKGSDNDSGVLAGHMANPTELGASGKEARARPKHGEAAQQSANDPAAQPNPIYMGPPHVGAYSCEAHHLISGKQALGTSRHEFEQWIAASPAQTIEKDTGYSVNNAANGIWAPSIPEKYKGGEWGRLSFDEKYAIAKLPMVAGLPQFHKGPHNIADPDDPEGEVNERYNDYLIKMLKAMNDRMVGWCAKCPLTENASKKPFQPSVRVNQVLDNLSRVVRRKISPPASDWRIFLSRYALQYHSDIPPPPHVGSV